MSLFSRKTAPYAPIVDFIDAAVESAEIAAWLGALESEPDHMRSIRLAEIKNRMEYNQAPQKHIEIVDLLNNSDVLQAMNKVVDDVRKSGMLTGKFVRKKDPESFNLLVGLIAAAFSDDT